MQYNEFTKPTVGKQIILSNQINKPTIGRIRVVLWKKILDRVMNTRQLLVWKMYTFIWNCYNMKGPFIMVKARKKAQKNWLMGRVQWFIFQNEGRDRNKGVKVT